MSVILRIVAGGLVAIVCAYVGVLIKRRYKLREQFFADVADYLAFFEKELTFCKTPVPEVNAKFLKRGCGEFRNYLSAFCANQADDKKGFTFLKKDERLMLGDALLGLDKSDYREQQSYVKRWQA